MSRFPFAMRFGRRNPFLFKLGKDDMLELVSLNRTLPLACLISPSQFVEELLPMS